MVNPIFGFELSKYLRKTVTWQSGGFAFYSDHNRASEDVECQSNRHLLTPFRVVLLTAVPLAWLYDSVGIPN